MNHTSRRPENTTDPEGIEIAVQSSNPKSSTSPLGIIIRTAVCLILSGYSVRSIYKDVNSTTTSKREVRVLQDKLEGLVQKADRSNEALEELNLLWSRLAH